jgi:hypothetical protein
MPVRGNGRGGRNKCRGFSRLAALSIGLTAVALSAGAHADAEDDGDWEMTSAPAHEPTTGRVATIRGGARTAAKRSFVACGEEAVAASPQVKAIVAEINREWNSDVEVYQSIQASGPHARPGGCIFYRPEFMAGLLSGWMNIKEARELKPMVYAIFAHEVGHEVHGDFSASRANVSGEERELEADRFAGYTMSFLRIQPDDVTTYYRLTGDDFTGGQHSHGTSDQRASAFEHGWKLAEAGSSEQSIIPAAGLGQP